jgi:hypothetical protein
MTRRARHQAPAAVLAAVGLAAAALAAGGLVAPVTAAAAPVVVRSAPTAVDAGRRIPFRFLEFLCETPRRNIPVLRSTGGDVGAVKLVQYSLRFLDYPVGPVDGVYGSVTRAAVRRYQQDHGLVVDGTTGPQTWGSIQRVVC